MSIKPLMWSFSQCLHVIRSCQNNTWMLNVLTTRCLKTNILENLLIGVFYDHYIIKYLVLFMTFNTPCLLAAYQIPSQGSISTNTRDRPILMRGTGGVMNLLKPQPKQFSYPWKLAKIFSYPMKILGCPWNSW